MASRDDRSADLDSADLNPTDATVGSADLDGPGASLDGHDNGHDNGPDDENASGEPDTSAGATSDNGQATESASAPSSVDSAAARHPDIADLPYEQARDELVSIVSRLEGGQVSLEDSMAMWERGEALAAHCSRWLEGAQARLEERDEPTS